MSVCVTVAKLLLFTACFLFFFSAWGPSRTLAEFRVPVAGAAKLFYGTLNDNLVGAKLFYSTLNDNLVGAKLFYSTLDGNFVLGFLFGCADHFTCCPDHIPGCLPLCLFVGRWWPGSSSKPSSLGVLCELNVNLLGYSQPNKVIN